MENQIVPKEYIAIKQLNFCNNSLENVQFIFADDGFYPLLIGEGDEPQIWLYIKVKDTIIPIVEKNQEKINKIIVVKDQIKKYIRIVSLSSSIKTEILFLSYSEDIAKVTNLDLRPLGYNITGTESQLDVGGTTLLNNTMKGVNTFVDLK